MEREWEFMAARTVATPPSPWAEETLDYFGYYHQAEAQRTAELARIAELAARLR